MSTTGLKRAAAHIATLTKADQTWMLAQLPRDHARVIRGYLKRPELVAVAHSALALDIAPPADAPEEQSASPFAAIALDSLAPSWAALWLKSCMPDQLPVYVEQSRRARGAAVEDAAKALPAELPLELRRALASWEPVGPLTGGLS
jgi:hypothetical protein